MIHPRKILIIGGGLSGLAAAYRLQELGNAEKQDIKIKVEVLEAGPHLGGLLHTESRDGFLLESGAESFLADKPWAWDLCRRLGIENELIQTNPACRRSFIAMKNRLHPIPKGFYLMAPRDLGALWRTPLLSWRGKLRMAAELFIPRKMDSSDESVAAFIRRRLGDEALERLGQPLIGGIYAADPELLSLQATFPQFLEMEHLYGSVIRGLRTVEPGKTGAIAKASGPRYSLFMSFRHGMGRLIEALAGALPPGTCHTQSPVVRIAHENIWRVYLENGEVHEADAVVLALPAYRAAKMVRDLSSLLTEHLRAIPYESAATVHLAFRRAAIGHPLNGFGFVVPASEELAMTGCTFSSIKFEGRAPDADTVLLRAFIGGPSHRALLRWEDAEVAEAVVLQLRSLLDLSEEPQWVQVHRFERAMPQYRVGHLARVRRIETEAAEFPGLYLTGNAFHGVGIPDCIYQAESVAERVMVDLKTCPFLLPAGARP